MMGVPIIGCLQDYRTAGHLPPIRAHFGGVVHAVRETGGTRGRDLLQTSPSICNLTIFLSKNQRLQVFST